MIADHIECPSCSTLVLRKILYERKKCPVMNNVTYDTYKESKICLSGDINLTRCEFCGLIFNSSFDKSLINYDMSYNNLRSLSQVYIDHLSQVANICSEFINQNDIVLDIGCGKGDFLKKLNDVTGCKGFGYDQSYDGEKNYNDNTVFFNNYFDPNEVQTSYDAIVLRHVLEHIPDPYEFLLKILNKKIIKNGTNLLIEVPDIDWIIKNKTFYDITYEHCNYFSKNSLSNLLNRLGWHIEKIQNVYDGQYLLLNATYNGYFDKNLNNKYEQISKINFQKFEEAKKKFCETIKNAENVCIWGASGKGVLVLSEFSEELLEKVKFVIDINPKKQGKYLPLSGKLVTSPNILKNYKGQLVVIVMNEIYQDEIKKNINSMGVDAIFINSTFGSL